jgi:hypothetical protein
MSPPRPAAVMRKDFRKVFLPCECTCACGSPRSPLRTAVAVTYQPVAGFCSNLTEPSHQGLLGQFSVVIRRWGDLLGNEVECWSCKSSPRAAQQTGLCCSQGPGLAWPGNWTASQSSSASWGTSGVGREGEGEKEQNGVCAKFPFLLRIPTSYPYGSQG